MKKTKIIALVLILALSLSLVLAACKGDGVGEQHVCAHKCDVCGGCKDPNCTDAACATKCKCYDLEDLTIRDAQGKNGAVSAASAYASKAGLDILQEGGNAFEAAAAVAFALSVTEPYHTGLGGGGFMMTYNAKTGEVQYFNMREFGGEKSTPGEVLTDYEAQMKRGTGSAGVPTYVAGVLGVMEKFPSGNVTRQQVLQPAIDLAEDGFKVAPAFAKSLSLDTFTTRGVDEAIEIYSKNNMGLTACKTGDILRNPNQAKVLKEIAEKGKDGFYKGWVAEAILDSLKEGGTLTQADLDYASANYPRELKPLHQTYTAYSTGETYDVYTVSPAVSGGQIMLEALNLVEYYCKSNNTSLVKMGQYSTEYFHVLGSAMQFAFGDGRQYRGDPIDLVSPTQGVISKGYAAARWDAAFDPNHAVTKTYGSEYGEKYGVNPWDYNDVPKPVAQATIVDNSDNEYPGTSAFSVADKDGNIVSMISTLNSSWGSYVMPKGTGFFLNNVYTNMNLSAGTNTVGPKRQPTCCMNPVIVTKNGVPFLSLGSPGSNHIPTASMQTFLNVVDYGMDIQSAISGSRVFSYYAKNADVDANGMGLAAQGKKLMLLETMGVDPSVVAQLKAMNYYIDSADQNTSIFGGVHAIMFNYDANGNLVNLTAGADPRRDGKALAY